MQVRTLFCVGWMVCSVVAQASAAVPLASPLGVDQLDLDATATFAGGTSQPTDLPTLISVLGLHEKANDQRWTGGTVVAGQQPQAVQYRFAFKSPVTVGSLLVFGGPRKAALLRADAPYPGDPANPDHWTPVAFPRRQTTGRTATLAQPIATRAVLLTDRTSRGRSYLEVLRLWSERLHNAAPQGVAYAEREYYRPPANFSSPFTYQASLVTSGDPRGWVSAGKNSDGLITVPPISDVAPTWFMVTWDQAKTLSGLWLDGNLLRYELDYFVGPDSVNPRAGVSAEWQRLSSVERLDKRGTWIAFPPTTTRGIRFRITQAADGRVAEIRSLHALVNLGTAPLPVAALEAAGPEVDPSLAPKQIGVDMPFDGKLTVVIDGPDGRRVRNVVGRESFAAGRQPIGWNLQDESGRYVVPGTYKWKAVAHPPLELKYEQTVYPNVAAHAPDNAPWQTKHDGPDGWLADHTAPISGAAVDGKMYLGSATAESGVSLIECDLDGRKTWGHHSFAAWTGPRLLAGYDKTLFVGARMENGTKDVVWTVDTDTKKVTPLLNLAPSGLSKRGMQSLAAHDGTLAMSVRGDPSYLSAAASPADVDLDNCRPAYAPQRKAVKGLSVDKRGDFLRLFRLQGTPPGSATQDSLVWIETEKASGNQLHIVLAFGKPIPLGSVVLSSPPQKDAVLKLSVLKKNAAYPPNVHDASQWEPLPAPATPQWDCIPAPPGTETRALRITFARGNAAGDGDDPLASLLDRAPARDVPSDPLDIDAKKPTTNALLGDLSSGEWQAKLEGVKLLRRRFESRLAQATIRVNSGTVKGMTWDAQRNAPLTEESPGIYVMQWNEPQSLQGLAIREIDGKLTKIDVYEGPTSGEIDIAAADGWREVATYEQARRYWYQPDVNHNSDARYMDGYVDFGDEVKTRAVRLRVVEQWTDKGPGRPYGGRVDLSGQDIEPARCRIYGVVPLAYVGGEAPVESGLSERIEIYAGADGKLQRQIALDKPGAIAYDPQGRLYAVSGTQIVRVDSASGGATPFITDLVEPTDFAFDAAGNLYVFDAAPDRKQIRVYDAAGKPTRTLGTPGGFQVGAWDPTRLGKVTAIDVDARGQVWAVENQFYPKRVTVWSSDGEFLREHLGNTEYGGGGVLDPADKTRVIVGPLEFAVDWNAGTSKIKNLTWAGTTEAGEVPVRVNDRLYFVTRPRFADMPCGIVYLYEDGKLKLVAAAGKATGFAPLKAPAVIAKFGNQSLPERRFFWSDLNDDGAVQAEEVTLTPDANPRPVTNFGPDLGLQAVTVRYEVTGFTPGGAPIYAERSFPQLTGQALYRLSDGNFHRLGSTAALPEALLAPDGTPIWTHRSEGDGVHSLYSCGPWRPDQVVAQFGVVGHIPAGKNPLGELLVFHANAGGWNVWTADGLLIGPIFHDQRDGTARPWSMREHARGEVLANVTPGQEHFHGNVCLSEDGKFRVVAGHNHVSLLEVAGLDQAVRLEGTIDVSADDLQRTQAWATAREQEDVYVRAPVIDCYRTAEPPAVDGTLDEWRDSVPATLGGDKGPAARFYMSYDDQNLYLAYGTRNFGPLKNSGGNEFQRLFKTGASVDLQIGFDPAADDRRAGPVAGDVRLLLTFVGGEPQAVVYRPVVSGTSDADVYRVVSPVGEVTFDRIERLSSFRAARTGGDDSYEFEAAIPLTSLGLKPADGLRLKMDWGLLVSGPDGNEVLRRVYWANQATNITADAPSEARLHPNLWGHVLFHDRKQSAADRLEPFGKPTTSKGLDALLDGN